MSSTRWTKLTFLGTFVAALFVGEAVAQEAPPVITYGDARESRDWIDTGRSSVAVDKGVEWQGVKIYLSLTWDLVAVDAASGKTLWAVDVGAFWNVVTFKETPAVDGRKSWAVELRPGPRVVEGKDRRQYHDLKTGKRVMQDDAKPKGTPLTPLTTWSGRRTKVSKALRTVIDNAADFRQFVVEPYFEGLKGAPEFGTIDFTKHVALVVISADSWNCDGIDATAFEDEDRLLVRLHYRTFQTAGPGGGGQKVRPFGIFLLPKRDPFRTIVVERNRQNLINGPELWSEFFRFTAIPRPPEQSGGDAKDE